MKRKLFFWLEKLKITRAERNAVTALMIMLMLLLIIKKLIPDSLPYNDQYYSELEQEFKKRSELLRQKEDVILARYQPQLEKVIAPAPDTIINDTTKSRSKLGKTDPAEPAIKVNINTADAKTLESLPGIGPAYAARIIDYRTKNGLFTSYDELLKIKGIGKKRLEKLLPFIQLKSPVENK